MDQEFIDCINNYKLLNYSSSYPEKDMDAVLDLMLINPNVLGEIIIFVVFLCATMPKQRELFNKHVKNCPVYKE